MMEDLNLWLALISVLMTIAIPIAGFVFRGIQLRIDKNESRLEVIDKEGRDRAAGIYDRMEQVDDKISTAKDDIHKQIIDLHDKLGEVKADVARVEK